MYREMIPQHWSSPLLSSCTTPKCRTLPKCRNSPEMSQFSPEMSQPFSPEMSLHFKVFYAECHKKCAKKTVSLPYFFVLGMK